MKKTVIAAALCLPWFAGPAFAHGETPDPVAPDIIKAIVPAIQKCWSPPVAATGEKPHASLKLRLNQDGTLSADPEILAKPEGASGEAFAQSAVSAIKKCQPFAVLDPYPYERWKEIIINFDI